MSISGEVTPKYELVWFFNNEVDPISWTENLRKNFLQLDSVIHSDIIGTLGETIKSKAVVYYTDKGSGGRWYEALASGEEHSIWMGMTREGGEAGSEVRIKRKGYLQDDVNWSWASGEILYLSDADAGYLTNTAPTKRLPIAVAIGGGTIFLLDTDWGTTVLPTQGRVEAEELKLIPANEDFGSAQINSLGGVSGETLTDSTGGSATTTIQAITSSGEVTKHNDNYASVTAQVNNLQADVTALQSKVDDLLVELRKSTGCGVLSD